MIHPIRDSIDPELRFSLDENNSEVDGVHILAKVKGEFFVPDGKSRNDRWYPRSLWEKVISDNTIQAKLKNRTMFGTIGHPKPDEEANDNDMAVREGLVSHVMTSIYIDENGKGIGEAYILGTPTGRILNTVLRAGSKLAVSSRADGTFKGKRQGLPIVDENTFNLIGWDFVLDPGFLEANPKIAESYNEIKNVKESNMEKEGNMDQKLVEHIANENAELKNQVKNLVDEVETLKEDKSTIEEENTHVKTELGKLEESEKLLNEYKEIGTVEEIKEVKASLETAEKTVSEYTELSDSPEHAKTIMERAHEFVTSIKEEFGTVGQIKESIKEGKELSEKVEDLGGIEKVTEALTLYAKQLDEKNVVDTAAKVKELAEELGLKEEKVTELLGKYSEEDIKDLYKTVSEKKEKSPYEKKNFNEENNEDNDADVISESTILGSTRADRIAAKL